MKTVTGEWLQGFLMKHRDEQSDDVQQDTSFPRAPRIKCADGFSMSVQASHGAYCRPRTNLAKWESVEVGFPSDAPESFIDYAEDPGSPTDTVYGYVPVDLVIEEINRHGGVSE